MRLPLLVSWAFALAIVASASSASAFCRTTTCEPDLETCARDERGCVRDGVPLRWTKLPLIYRVSARGSTAFDRDAARTKIAAAFDRWTQAACPGGRRTSLRFVEGDSMPEDKPLGQKRGPEPFGIYFRDDTWPYARASTTLAITNQEYGKETGRIIYSDIEINTTRTLLGDLDVVVTHEAGHYLGLAHSRERGSIMAESYISSNDRDLSPDDVAGACELFPPDGLPPEEEEGCNVAASDATQSPRSSPPVSALALAIGALALLRRRAASSAAYIRQR